MEKLPTYIAPAIKRNTKNGTLPSLHSNKKPDFVLDCCRSINRLPNYDGFKDKNLVSYFANERILKHLEKTYVVHLISGNCTKPFWQGGRQRKAQNNRAIQESRKNQSNIWKNKNRTQEKAHQLAIHQIQKRKHTEGVEDTAGRGGHLKQGLRGPTGKIQTEISRKWQTAKIVKYDCISLFLIIIG